MNQAHSLVGGEVRGRLGEVKITSEVEPALEKKGRQGVVGAKSQDKGFGKSREGAKTSGKGRSKRTRGKEEK